MKHRMIWIGSLCVLIAMVLWLFYKNQLHEGFVDVTLATAQASLKTAKEAVTTAQTSIATANSALPATTIATAKAAVTKANTAVTDANTAKINADTAVSDANSLVTSTQTALGVTGLATASLTTLQSAMNTASATLRTKNTALTTATSSGAKSTWQSSIDNAVPTRDTQQGRLNTLNREKTALDTIVNDINGQQSLATVNALITQYTNNLSNIENDHPYYNQYKSQLDYYNNIKAKYYTGNPPPKITELSTAQSPLKTHIIEYGSNVLDENNITSPYSYTLGTSDLTSVLNTAYNTLTNADINNSIAQLLKSSKNTIATAQGYIDAINTAESYVSTAQAAYDKASTVYNVAKVAQDAAAAQADAIQAQTDAGTALRNAKAALTGADTAAVTLLTNARTADNTFMQLAATFSNPKFTIMSSAWTAYTGTPLPSTTTDPVTATDTILSKYEAFTNAKTAYISAVLATMNENKATESTFVQDNSQLATTLATGGYMDVQIYNDMAIAWNAYNDALTANSAFTTILTNYNTYLAKKKVFQEALLISQGKEADAVFLNKRTAANNDKVAWLSAGTNECRNVQTTASTDPNQEIKCADNEYISGYNKVSGFEAAASAPADSNVTKANIAQYLAYKYSCCTAPFGAPGEKGNVGAEGRKGDTGDKGPKGDPGKMGAPGESGGPGERGAPGRSGVRGEKGPMGERGARGPMGPAGESIKTNTVVKQVAGPIGPRGPDGPIGPIGPVGPIGGPAKKSTIGPSPVILDKTLSLLSIENKIRKFISQAQQNGQERNEHSPSILQGNFYQKADYSY